MSVFQISRIQHRRGKKNETGIPQLASGELGWAVDTQQLYIGNGAVSEGAPYVGNTEILTEHSNFLELAGQYQFKNSDPTIQTGPSITYSVSRSIQDRLDDIVSIRSFIHSSDELSGNYTAAIQRAIDQLFLNTNKNSPSSRVVLELPAGLYIITGSLKLPPFATIRGAGKDKTIIRQTGAFPLAYTVSRNSTPGNYFPVDSQEFQSKSIELSDMTLEHTVAGVTALDLTSTKNSLFRNVKFQGTWIIGANISPDSCAVNLSALSSLVTCENNLFENCEFTGFSYGVYSDYDIKNNIFANCLFEILGIAVKFGDTSESYSGKQFGPRFNRIINNRFYRIGKQAIFIDRGRGNLSQGNTFIEVGNDGSSSRTAAYPVIWFTDTGNVSDQDYFERSYNLSTGNSEEGINIDQDPYVSEYKGSVVGAHKYNRKVFPVYTPSYVPLFRLGGYNNAQYRVHYIYTSTAITAVRRGTLFITVDAINNQVVLTDDYDFSGNEAYAENLIFTASYDDVVSSSPQSNLLNPGRETVNINYINLTTGDTSLTSSFVFWYEVQS